MTSLAPASLVDVDSLKVARGLVDAPLSASCAPAGVARGSARVGSVEEARREPRWRAFERWLKAHRYADKTTRLYVRHAVRCSHRMLELFAVDLADVDEVQLYEWWADLTPATRNQGRAAMVAYYRSTGARGGEPAIGIPTLPEPDRDPRPVGETHYLALLAAASRLGGIHEVAGLMFGCTGARFTEVQRARWDLMDLDNIDDAWWQIVGKGAGRRGPKERHVALDCELVVVLRAWRSQQEPKSLYVFGSERSSSGHLSGPTLRRVVDEISEEANRPRIVPHVYRHTVATLLAEHLGDITAVQELLGHANLTTTQKYTKVRPQRIRAAVQQLTALREAGPSATPAE